MSSTDFFHGITVALVETGARIIALPSSSIIGLVDTFTPGVGLVAAFNRSTAGVRLEMPGRSDLFAERMISAQGFKGGLDGEYLVDSREQVFTQSGWSTTIECNAGKKGKAKVKGKKPEKTLKIVQL